MADSSNACLNCGTILYGKFCHLCGQKVIEPKERKVKYFLIQFLGSAFFLENSFLKNLWNLITKPGLLTSDFIEGRRKRWMPPLSIFLLINLFYFWFTPLSDLKLRLYEQLHQPHHAQLAAYLVDQKLKAENISLKELENRYDAKRSTYADTLIILHIPIMAAFMALMFFRKKLYYTDHFIYCLHFFSFILLLGLIQSGLTYLFAWFDVLGDKFWSIGGIIFLLLIAFYIMVSVKKVYYQKTLKAILLIAPIMFVFVITHFIYRTLLFLITFSLI